MAGDPARGHRVGSRPDSGPGGSLPARDLLVGHEKPVDRDGRELDEPVRPAQEMIEARTIVQLEAFERPRERDGDRA
jgi:hypothetical protein